MIQIDIPGGEYYDNLKEEFFYLKPVTLRLEHSLISLSKWESKWHEFFISSKQKTKEQTIDYIRCMTIDQNVDDGVYYRIPQSEIDKIEAYIHDPMSATTFHSYGNEVQKKPGNGEQVSSELIYYWMFSLNIPIACEKWHLTRLLNLIRIFEVKSQKQKPRSKKDILNSYMSLNAKRKAMHHTRG